MPGCQEEAIPNTEALKDRAAFFLPESSPSLPNSDGMDAVCGEVGTSEADSWTTGPTADGILDFLIPVSLQLRKASTYSLAPVTLRKGRLHGPYKCPTSCFTRILTASGTTATTEPTVTGLRCCQDMGGPPVEGTVCQGRGGSMQRTLEASSYLLHSVRGKPRQPLQSLGHLWQSHNECPVSSASAQGKFLF